MESHSPGLKSLVSQCQTGKKNHWPRTSPTELHGSGSREPSYTRKLEDQIILEHVLGMTVTSNSALTSDPRSGLVAYPAGCVLVLLDTVKNKQLGTLHTPRKSITAVSFSPDGRYILTGESGLQPAVRVWDINIMSEIAMLRGHSFGIKTAVFSPRMREIIVVGDAKDMMISVWTWPGKVMVSLNKFSDDIYAMDVSSSSQYFVTVGNKQVKFYYLDTKQWPGSVDRICPIPLTCRYGMLDNLKENCFCDVACGRDENSFVFVVTTSGILCQLNSNRFLERWVNVNMTRACSLTTDGSHVFVGGCQGLVRMFDAYTLKIVLTLPRPHCLGLDIAQVGVAAQLQSPKSNHIARTRPRQNWTIPVTTSNQSNASGNIKHTPSKDVEGDDNGEDHDDDGGGNGLPKLKTHQHPSAKALTYDPEHENLTVVYDDNSVYIWARQAGTAGDGSVHFEKRYSSMYHRGSVWDLTLYPVAIYYQPKTLATASEDSDLGGALPPGSLLSVSADGTLRAWDVSADICRESLLKRNSVSPQCLKIVYADRTETTSAKKVPDTTLKRTGKPLDAGLPGNSALKHRKYGFTVVSVCPDGVHIATGNRYGRVCIYDAHTMVVIATMHAHEGEVTALGYSISENYKILASGSRDRMIHVMDASRGYQLLTTLDDHSSTITAINFTYISHYMIMATSSLDMSVLVRVYMGSESFVLNPVRAIVEKKSIMDFAIHPWSGSMAFACQDRHLRIYSIMTSTDQHSFCGCPSYGGQLVKVQFDPSGQYLLTACSLKTINLLQYATGTLLNTFNGHAESITSIRFSHNVKHVISSAVDGCIFLWRLPDSVTYAVKREMAEMGRLTKGMVFKRSWKKSTQENLQLPKPTEGKVIFQEDAQKNHTDVVYSPEVRHQQRTSDFVNRAERLYQLQQSVGEVYADDIDTDHEVAAFINKPLGMSHREKNEESAHLQPMKVRYSNEDETQEQPDRYHLHQEVTDHIDFETKRIEPRCEEKLESVQKTKYHHAYQREEIKQRQLHDYGNVYHGERNMNDDALGRQYLNSKNNGVDEQKRPVDVNLAEEESSLIQQIVRSNNGYGDVENLSADEPDTFLGEMGDRQRSSSPSMKYADVNEPVTVEKVPMAAPSQGPDAWLNACCERRRIFKLEAKSIKRILGMMRLVTDAMEKDLANANMLVSQTNFGCPPSVMARPSIPDNAFTAKRISPTLKHGGKEPHYERKNSPYKQQREISFENRPQKFNIKNTSSAFFNPDYYKKYWYEDSDIERNENKTIDLPDKIGRPTHETIPSPDRREILDESKTRIETEFTGNNFSGGELMCNQPKLSDTETNTTLRLHIGDHLTSAKVHFQDIPDCKLGPHKSSSAITLATYMNRKLQCHDTESTKKDCRLDVTLESNLVGDLDRDVNQEFQDLVISPPSDPDIGINASALAGYGNATSRLQDLEAILRDACSRAGCMKARKRAAVKRCKGDKNKDNSRMSSISLDTYQGKGFIKPNTYQTYFEKPKSRARSNLHSMLSGRKHGGDKVRLQDMGLGHFTHDDYALHSLSEINVTASNRYGRCNSMHDLHKQCSSVFDSDVDQGRVILTMKSNAFRDLSSDSIKNNVNPCFGCSVVKSLSDNDILKIGHDPLSICKDSVPVIDHAMDIIQTPKERYDHDDRLKEGDLNDFVPEERPFDHSTNIDSISRIVNSGYMLNMVGTSDGVFEIFDQPSVLNAPSYHGTVNNQNTDLKLIQIMGEHEISNNYDTKRRPFFSVSPRKVPGFLDITKRETKSEQSSPQKTLEIRVGEKRSFSFDNIPYDSRTAGVLKQSSLRREYVGTKVMKSSSSDTALHGCSYINVLTPYSGVYKGISSAEMEKGEGKIKHSETKSRKNWKVGYGDCSKFGESIATSCSDQHEVSMSTLSGTFPECRPIDQVQPNDDELIGTNGDIACQHPRQNYHTGETSLRNKNQYMYENNVNDSKTVRHEITDTAVPASNYGMCQTQNESQDISETSEPHKSCNIKVNVADEVIGRRFTSNNKTHREHDERRIETDDILTPTNEICIGTMQNTVMKTGCYDGLANTAGSFSFSTSIHVPKYVDGKTYHLDRQQSFYSEHGSQFHDKRNENDTEIAQVREINNKTRRVTFKLDPLHIITGHDRTDSNLKHGFEDEDACCVEDDDHQSSEENVEHEEVITKYTEPQSENQNDSNVGSSCKNTANSVCSVTTRKVSTYECSSTIDDVNRSSTNMSTLRGTMLERDELKTKDGDMSPTFGEQHQFKSQDAVGDCIRHHIQLYTANDALMDN